MVPASYMSLNKGVTLAMNVNGLLLSIFVSKTGAELLDSFPSGSLKLSFFALHLNINFPSVTAAKDFASFRDLVNSTPETLIEHASPFSISVFLQLLNTATPISTISHTFFIIYYLDDKIRC